MRAGAIPELVDENTGVLAEPNADVDASARQLAGAIAGLYERDLDALGAAARRHVVSNYSWSRALQSLMGRYQSALASRIPAGLQGLARAGTTQ
jgi:alpha-1,6-mannosyltransferase